MAGAADRTAGEDRGLRQTVAIVAILNFAYFGVEAVFAAWISSVALFADSVDFLEDASINLLVLVAMGWSAARRRVVGVVLAGIILLPGLAALWTAYQKLGQPVVPEPWALTAAGAGALAVNLTCAILLSRVAGDGGSLSKAAFLSARNDVVANVAIIGAGLATAATLSPWPDLVVGIGIALMNAGAAWEVYEAAEGESDKPERRVRS
jgi:Co/Zn/Cd efflux system component